MERNPFFEKYFITPESFFSLSEKDLTDQFKSLCDKGMNAIQMVTSSHLTSSLIEKMKLIVDLSKKNNVVCFVSDDPLLMFRVASHGIVFSSVPKNLSRIHEVVGPEYLVGFFSDNNDFLDEFSSSPMSEYADFFVSPCNLEHDLWAKLKMIKHPRLAATVPQTSGFVSAKS